MHDESTVLWNKNEGGAGDWESNPRINLLPNELHFVEVCIISNLIQGVD